MRIGSAYRSTLYRNADRFARVTRVELDITDPISISAVKLSTN